MVQWWTVTRGADNLGHCRIGKIFGCSRPFYICPRFRSMSVICDRAALMRRMFGKFDKDGSGALDRKELQNATRLLGDRFSNEDVDILMEILDKDHSETVDLEEFIQAFMNRRR